MSTIETVSAWEILDSRGNPTVRVAIEAGGERGVFSVPSGASTGVHEALERRDDADRYGGKGVQEAIDAVERELADAVIGRDVFDQRGLDNALVELDGTEKLERLGANAVLGVSGAAIRTAASVAGRPLYEYIGQKHHSNVADGTLPMPMVNILSGGLHARGGIEIQDFLVIPTGADTYSEGLAMVWQVRDAVESSIVDAGHRPLVADEGGFAPPLDSIEDAFDLVVNGIEAAGFVPGTDLGLAVDVAASHFYDQDTQRYTLSSVDATLRRSEMVDRVVSWTEQYPLVSIEDPLDEDDWAGWEELASRLTDVQLLGDDLLVTNGDRLDHALERDAANAVLVKPNQAGTISRAIDVVHRAQDAGCNPVISARSGETCDSTIADLAVGLDAGQIKIGSLARSERLAKYNRLLEIEAETLRGFASFTLPTV
ncbi:phosphopyruvate hydratase [Halopenitus sp. H-Gu1]|uniref:phosphopyruvate hydratase n=1 Tax=Halopenitus sp. H-Gu1 TaxID=3242697 RepID=UPI00359DD6C6